MRINEWNDWYSIEAAARRADGTLGGGERLGIVPVQLWVPDNYVGAFAAELIHLDADLRRGAALLPFRLFSRREFTFAPIPNLPDPVNPLDGRLDLVAARREGSVLADLAAVGATAGLLVDAPVLFFMLRAASRRLPFRIRFERRDRPSGPDQPPSEEPIEGHFSDRQRGLVEESRIVRRIRVEHPSGTTIEVEEFE